MKYPGAEKLAELEEAEARGIVPTFGPHKNFRARWNWRGEDYLVAADRLEDAYLPLAAAYFREIGEIRVAYESRAGQDRNRD
jgi:hypothetical protein